MRTFGKVVLAAVLTVVCRVVFQLPIPDSVQTVLPASVFVEHGWLPVAFCVYALVAYSAMAGMFLLVRDRLGGPRPLQGLRFGVVLAVVWVVFLWEPLPHVTSLLVDVVAYCVADGAALLILGTLTGVLLGTTRPAPARRAAWKGVVVTLAVVTVLFVGGRLVEYVGLGSYSSWAARPVVTIVWCVAAGAVCAGVVIWLAWHTRGTTRLACYGWAWVVFTVDLAAFNFFVPLVYKVDFPGVVARTGIDALTVAAGLALATILAATWRARRDQRLAPAMGIAP